MKEAKYLWRKILSHIALFRYDLISMSNFAFNIFNFPFSSKLPLSPTGRGSSAAAASFSRNVPERSTFHSGMTRNRTRAPYAGIPTSSQDTSALNSRPSTFFSKLSSKFSKRLDEWVVNFFLLRVFELIRPMLILLSLRVLQALIQVFQNFWPRILLTYYVQVNNYEIVVTFFHISNNLTWYSAIVHKFTRIYPVCSSNEMTKQFM